MADCPQINNTTIIGTSAVSYDSTPLPCTGVNTCDDLNTILAKFDNVICSAIDSVNILSEEIMNITEDIMIITEEIENINNQIFICCPICDFTITATELPVCEFTVTATELPICDFTGSVNQLPDPTTTSTSSTTTSTTTEYLSREFCAWSTNIYDFPTLTSEFNPIDNTLTGVPIDNDLTGLASVGIASTSIKFWKNDPLGRTMREWWISSYPAALTFNRNITYSNLFPNYENVSTIVAVDDTTILTTLNSTSPTYPNGVPGSVYLWKYDITGNSAGNGTLMFGIQAKNYATSMMFTTDSKLIVSAFRVVSSVNVYYLTQYSYPDGLLEVDISLASLPFDPSASVDAIYVITYNSEIYLVRSNDSSLFKIDTTYPYAITEVTANLGFSQYRQFESSTGECNNVSFTPQFPECGTALPALGGSLIYNGRTVTNTAWSGGVISSAGAAYYLSCSGLYIPASVIIFNGAPFSYTLTFSTPINNVAIIIGILNLGDDFTITTNEEIPSIAYTTVCYAHVTGNQIISDPEPVGSYGSGEFIITTLTDFTELTIQGTNGGNGGPIVLSCDPNPPITSTTTTTSTTLAPTGFNTIYTHFEAI